MEDHNVLCTISCSTNTGIQERQQSPYHSRSFKSLSFAMTMKGFFTGQVGAQVSQQNKAEKD